MKVIKSKITSERTRRVRCTKDGRPSNRGRYTKETRAEVPVYCEKYNSISEFVDILNKRDVKFDWEYWAKSATNRVKQYYAKGDDWFGGVKDRDEAFHLLQYGWKQNVQALKGVLDTKTNSNKSVMKHDYMGFAPCVSRAIIGHPKAMYSMRGNVVKNKIITITYNLSVNLNISGNEILTASKNILKTIVTLEKNGYRVNLNACLMIYGNDNNEVAIVIIKLKDAKQSLNLSAVTFALIHPAFFRCCGFAWIETMPVWQNYESGRGGAIGDGAEIYSNGDYLTFNTKDTIGEDVISYNDATRGTQYLIDKLTK